MGFFQRVSHSLRQFGASHFGGVTNTQQPDKWLSDWVAGGLSRSHAGVTVSPVSSMALSAYYACMRAIAEDVAKLPLQILERTDSGKQQARDNVLWDIFNTAPNPDMTAMSLRETLTHHALGWGNGYGLILRDRSMTMSDGEVEGIYPIHPSRVDVKRSDNGAIYYEVRQTSQTRDYQDVPTVVAQEDMLHLKGMGPDGLIGYSICHFAADSIGVSLAAQQYGASFFGNSAIPSGILRHPARMNPEHAKALKEQWVERFSGANAYGVALLEEGMEWQSIHIPPDQAQFLQTREAGDLDICRWFRMPPSKIAILKDAHYNNMEHENTNYVVDTLQPWFLRWEQEIGRKLLAGTNLYAKHEARGLLRGDHATRAAYYHQLAQVGAYSINDIRELEDMAPIEGGDEHFLQIQYAPIRKIVDGTAHQQAQAAKQLRSRPSGESDASE